MSSPGVAPAPQVASAPRSVKCERAAATAIEFLATQCVVCLHRPLDVVLEPCGHLCLCRGCSDRIKERCPICRKPIVRKQFVYIPSARRVIVPASEKTEEHLAQTM